jgi:hypothetical protein
MTDKLLEAARMALEAMELHATQYPHMQKGYTVDAIEALRAALAEQQEPLTFETAAEAKADREHAEAYYRQAEHLLTADERTLHAEIARLKAQLAEQPAEQEPVAWTNEDYTDIYVSKDIAEDMNATVAFYTSPQPIRRLTDEEIDAIWEAVPKMQFWSRWYARAIEDAIWSKT